MLFVSRHINSMFSKSNWTSNQRDI